MNRPMAEASAKEAAERVVAPRRIGSFVRFFRGYMSLSSVVAASLPIPVGSLHLIPTYAAQTEFLNLYASLFCFLLLGFIFYCRHPLGRWMFDDGDPAIKALLRLAPALLILACAASAIGYHSALQRSVQQAGDVLLQQGVPLTFPQILDSVDYRDIPLGGWLAALYLSIFLTAEAAFILMAIREYLQEYLELSDRRLIALRAADPVS